MASSVTRVVHDETHDTLGPVSDSVARFESSKSAISTLHSGHRKLASEDPLYVRVEHQSVNSM